MNPKCTGRPPGSSSIRASAARYARTAVDALAGVARDTTAPPGARVQAAETLLFYSGTAKEPGVFRRVLNTLLVVGEAYRKDGILISDALPFGQQCEVRAVLGELSRFAELKDCYERQTQETPCP